MLTIAGRGRSAFCDGVSRRDFLKIGGLALGGLSLPQLLARKPRQAFRGRIKRSSWSSWPAARRISTCLT